MSEPIEEWTSNDHIRMLITPSGNLGLVNEDEHTLKKNRGFILVGKEVNELFDFLLVHLDEIRRRQKAR